MYIAVYSLSVTEDCALAGVRISGIRYSAGSVDCTIHCLLVFAEGFSARCAAISKQININTHSKKHRQKK